MMRKAWRWKPNLIRKRGNNNLGYHSHLISKYNAINLHPRTNTVSTGVIIRNDTVKCSHSLLKEANNTTIPARSAFPTSVLVTFFYSSFLAIYSSLKKMYS